MPAPTCSPGPTCSAQSRGCPHFPRASSPSRGRVAEMSSDTIDTPDAEQAPAPIPLDEPSEGVPHVVDSERGLTEAADAIAAGEGPVAVDAERASGYRYGQRAYLVQ